MFYVFNIGFLEIIFRKIYAADKALLLQKPRMYIKFRNSFS